jgi:hypothetical protein
MTVAAYGLTWLNRALAERRGNRLSFIVMALIFVWAVMEAYSPTPRQQRIEAPAGMDKIVAGPVLNLPLVESDGYALFLQMFHRQAISTGYLARSSERRHAQFEALRRLFEEGGARLCDEAARMGFRNVVIAPAAYWSRQAALRVPLNLSQCRLNVVDLRGQENSATALAGEAGDVLPPQPESFPLVRGQTLVELSTPQADAFLWYGWSGREMYSRWTEQRSAAVVFALEAISQVSLRVKMSPYLAPGKLAAQRVKVNLNGESLTTLALNEASPQIYTIELPRQLLRERNVLTFEMPDAQSPKRLGASEDLRTLGINVQWLELTPSSAAR